MFMIMAHSNITQPHKNTRTSSFRHYILYTLNIIFLQTSSLSYSSNRPCRTAEGPPSIFCIWRPHNFSSHWRPVLREKWLLWKRSYLKWFILVQGPKTWGLIHKKYIGMAFLKGPNIYSQWQFAGIFVNFFLVKWRLDLFLRFGQKWNSSKAIRICANT